MTKWLARFSFSFILLAAVFTWEGYKIRNGDRGPRQETKMYAFFAAAAVCFVLGLRGVRERHRRFEVSDSSTSTDDRDTLR